MIVLYFILKGWSGAVHLFRLDLRNLSPETISHCEILYFETVPNLKKLQTTDQTFKMKGVRKEVGGFGKISYVRKPGNTCVSPTDMI